MLTSLIRALQGPYQVRASFTWAQPPFQLVVFERIVLSASVSLQLLENVSFMLGQSSLHTNYKNV